MIELSLKKVIEVSKKYKPKKDLPDYVIHDGVLLGWLFGPQRKKPSNKHFFKNGCWYYPMVPLRNFRRYKK
jgi:hypothetical protein